LIAQVVVNPTTCAKLENNQNYLEDHSKAQEKLKPFQWN